ncbi:MAG: adenylate/guanylate cyclase domain-containing protein [Bdellovibrionales bacterium]|nr:adenylate/guanylate cyclase domain-containing protein [Bdellovibrionales bacterium]
MKKNFKPFLIGVAVLLIFTLFVRDNSKHRFGQQMEDTGNTTGTESKTPVMGKLEWTWYDLKFRLIDSLKLRKENFARGVLVARIDDASLERFGSWPWNRSVYEAILSYLYDLGAEVVAFDAVFSEPEFMPRYVKEYMKWSGVGQPDSLQKELALDDAKVDTVSEKLPLIGNKIFGTAINNHPKTVLGYFWQAGAACKDLYDPADPKFKDEKKLSREEAAQLGLLHVETLVDNLSSLTNQGIVTDGSAPFEGRGETPMILGSCPTVNRNEIAAKAKYQGFFSAIADSDGIFRRLPLLIGFTSPYVPAGNRDFLPPEWFKSTTFFPSLAIEAVSAFWDSPGRKVETATVNGRTIVKAIEIKRKEGEPIRIVTLPDGTFPLNFYGTQASRERPIGEFSLANIEGAVRDPKFQSMYQLNPLKPLSGQIIFIGPTALGVYDLRPNPVQGDAAGVMLHATTAARLLEQARDPASIGSIRFASMGENIALLWGLGLLLCFWMLNTRALASTAGTFGMIGTFMAIDFVLFLKRGFALDAITVVLGLLHTFLAIFAWKYFTEEKDRAFVKGAFEKYVSPDLVGQIVADPKKLNLGGQRKELSVLFSDVRGFTTISEKMDAAGLAKFMNEYLSPMTDLVQANKGTIDKYMGDAIMAIFGAPIEYADHASKATDAALAMMAKLPAMNAEWATRGLPPIDIGIGINTGDMSVGNMGSSKIFSYTVMGDSVNLGSRLEGINKEYGTNIIVSEFTRKHLGPEFVCRELDRVKVKGKKLPVTIFEVMGKGSLPEKQQIAANFEKALALYYGRQFAEAKVLFAAQAAIDKTSAIYVQRCELWMEEAPEADWDGSWTMKTK